MTEPLNLDHRVISTSEMDKLLLDDPALQKKLDECEIQTVHVIENLPPDCLKQTLSIFVDPVSQDEIALISNSEKIDGTKSSVISRLRIGNIVWDREIP